MKLKRYFRSAPIHGGDLQTLRTEISEPRSPADFRPHGGGGPKRSVQFLAQRVPFLVASRSRRSAYRCATAGSRPGYIQVGCEYRAPRLSVVRVRGSELRLSGPPPHAPASGNTGRILPRRYARAARAPERLPAPRNSRSSAAMRKPAPNSLNSRNAARRRLARGVSVPSGGTSKYA